MWSPSSRDSANLSGACPTNKGKGTRLAADALGWPQGGCTQYAMPQSSRERRFGGPRASHGSGTICHQTPQACRPTTSLPATLAGPWFLLHLFGQQPPPPERALLLHSLQSPPLAPQTHVYVAHKAPGTINSPASPGWLRLRPGGLSDLHHLPCHGGRWGLGCPTDPVPTLCLLGAVFTQASSLSSLDPSFPDHKTAAKMGKVLVCNKYQFLYCYLTQTIR